VGSNTRDVLPEELEYESAPLLMFASFDVNSDLILGNGPSLFRISCKMGFPSTYPDSSKMLARVSSRKFKPSDE
jgi:hypothetical protein